MTSRRPLKLRVASVLAAGGLLLLAACGTSDADSSAHPFNAGSDLTGKPIDLGVLADSSSAGNSWSKYVPIIEKAWASYTNGHGGLNGHPIRLTIVDTKGDVPTAVAAANKMVADSNIAGVVVGDVNTDLQIGPILSKAKLPIIGGLGYTPQTWGGLGMGLPYVYGVSVTTPDNIESAITTAKAEGAQRWTAMLCTESPACAQAKPLLSSGLQQAGITDLGTLGAPAAAPNYTAQCLQAIQGKTDVISMQLQGQTAVRIAQDCVAQGYTGKFEVGQTTVTPDVYSKIKNLYGPLNGFPWYVDEAPVAAYRSQMKAEGVSESDWANPSATATYAGAKLFAKALSSVPENDAVTRQTVIDAYGKVKNETLGGLLPQAMTFTTGAKPAPVTCFWIYNASGDGAVTGSFKPTCDN